MPTNSRWSVNVKGRSGINCYTTIEDLLLLLYYTDNVSMLLCLVSTYNMFEAKISRTVYRG